MTGKKLGILGSGQLSWMLAQSALRKSFNVSIWSPGRSGPACELPVFIYEEISEFVKNSDRIIFESEFLNTKELKSFETPEKFIPQVEAIESLQDKLKQKYLFEELQIPTARFWVWDHEQETFEAWTEILFSQAMNRELVFKWSRMGYDGKGNFFWKPRSDFQSLKSFANKALRSGARVYAEESIDFQLELAMSICRTKESRADFPLVISKQEHGVCLEVQGPALSMGLAADLEEKAKESLIRIAEKLNFEGCLAGEFFLTRNSQILLNELAPRVHNSAHYTLDAFHQSQFDLQIDAAFGLSLPTPKLYSDIKYFGMRNLLSPFENGDLQEEARIEDLPIDRSRLYWYGKSKFSHLRKMGHINYVAASLDELVLTAAKLEDWEKDFWERKRSQVKNQN